MTIATLVEGSAATFRSTLNSNFSELLARIVALEAGSGPATNALLIVAFGESNSSGYALNTSLLAGESAARPQLQFLNVSTSSWQSLQIGTNNNLDSSPVNSTTHGWENETANACVRGEFDRPVYYVQTGQGGSLVGDWGASGGYWTKFLSRTGSAKTLLTSSSLKIAVWISIGINDAIAGTTGAAYTSGLSALITRVKAQLPSCKIMLSKIPPVNANYDAINTAIDTFSSDADVSIVPVVTPVTMSMRDTNHWDYAGMKTWTNRKMALTKTALGLPASRLIWTSSTMVVDQRTISATAISQFGNASDVITFASGDTIEFEPSAESYMPFVLSDNVTNQTWGSAASVYMHAYHGNALLNWGAVLGANVGTVSATGKVRYRYRRLNDDLLLESTDTNLITWTTHYTRAGILAGVPTVRVKCLSAVGVGTIRAWCNPGRSS